MSCLVARGLEGQFEGVWIADCRQELIAYGEAVKHVEGARSW